MQAQASINGGSGFDVAHKKEIEIALANGLGRENHPWVRRNFIEAYYNTPDDNLRTSTFGWNGSSGKRTVM
jgi:hypothetical protein